MRICNIKIPNIILYIVVLPLLPLSLTVLAILWLLRQGIRFWLQRKLGAQFGGLLISADKIYANPHGISKKVNMVLVYVQSEKERNAVEEVKRILQRKIFAHPQRYFKLLSTYHSLLGQEYFLKDQITVEDILKVIPQPESNVPFDDDYMKRFVGDVSSKPLPKNDTALLEVYTSNQPLVMNAKGFVYPVLIRLHHVVADGVRAAAFLSSVFSPNIVANYSDRLLVRDDSNMSIVKRLFKVSKYIVYFAYMLTTGLVTYLNFSFFKEKDVNALHGPALCGEKIMAWSTESDTSHMYTVKKIKNAVSDTRFTDVVFTCVSAGIYNYFKRKNFETPTKITCLIPLLFSLSTKSRMELKNEFTFGVLDMPLVNPSNFLYGLEAIKNSLNKMRESHDKDVVYWMTNYMCSPLPGPFIDLISDTSAYTCSISSFPGLGTIKIFDDCEVMSIFCSAPHTNHTGITFTILTYADKFHICLYVDKAIIAEQEDIQFIVDDILRNIEEFDQVIDNRVSQGSTSTSVTEHLNC